MKLDSGVTVSQTASSSSMTVNTYSNGIRTFPVAGYFEIWNAGTLVSSSRKFSEIYNKDAFQLVSAQSRLFYPNSMKDSIHNSLVGSLVFQDTAKTVTQEGYINHDWEGNTIESKSGSGTTWVYSQAGYDKYGNQLWTRDPTGRTTCTEYSIVNKYTYPVGTSSGGKMENFDWDSSWTLSRSNPPGTATWFTSQYSTTKAYSPTKSIQESFSGATGNGLDYGSVSYYKDVYANEISRISIRMYVDQYSHNLNAGDIMDSGIRIRIYDATGVNYANYTYWLACWNGNADSRITTDPTISIVCCKPTLNTWLCRDLYPSSTWDINWTRCDKVRLEVYTYCGYAQGDQFRVYYDDLAYDDQIDYEEIGDSFDSGSSWITSKWSSDNLPTWLSGGYSTARYSSSPKSMKVEFTSGTNGYDTGSVINSRIYDTDTVTKVSLKMYAEAYSHNENPTWDTMDAGLRIRLIDAAGSNYATYTYWLACWYLTAENKTTTDPTVKVVFGQPPMGQWKNLNFYPTKDFNINWTGCAKVQFDLYAYASGAYGDSLKIYFDDFSYKGGDLSRVDYAWDTNNGQLVSSTDPLGHSAITAYDLMGRVKRITKPDGKYIGYEYLDSLNKVVCTNELNQKSAIFYDCIGREIKVQRTGTGSAAYSTSTATYTWQDKPAKTVDPVGKTMRYSYDYLGRTTQIKNNDTKCSNVSYDYKNKKITIIDENNHKVVTVLDVLGRLEMTREYSTSTAFNWTGISYDAVGNVKTIRTMNGDVTNNYYDVFGRESSVQYPDGYSDSYTYDKAGRLLNMTARDGAATRNAYDVIGNVIRVSGTTDTITTVYDADGRILEKRNALGSISYQYDSRHRATRISEKINSTVYSIGYTYGDDDSVSSATYPDGRTISYLYDAYGRNVDIKSGAVTLLNVTYNRDDSVASKRDYDGGIKTFYTYNSRGLISRIVTKNYNDAIQLDLTYTYDNKGNVATITDAQRTTTERYYYDHADRLIRATGDWNLVTTLTYTYDSMGNRLTKNEGTPTPVNYSYDGSSNRRLTSDGTSSYGYDTNGNIITKTTGNSRFVYVYNSFGQMIQVRTETYSGGIWGSPVIIARYYYDANGARAKTEESGAINAFIYAGHDPLLQISADGKSNKYLYLNDKLEIRHIDGTNGFAYVADALGSTRKVFGNGDSTNVTFSALTYMPFGRPILPSGLDKVTFAGEMKDTPTGLIYLFARYCDPELGRFYSLDPELGNVLSPQTMNRYSYSINNPLTHVDPNGRSPLLIPALVGAIVGGLIGGTVAFITSNGDLRATAIGVLGGMAGGFIAVLTLGLGYGWIAAGALSGAVSSGFSAYAMSNGDLSQTLEGLAFGAVAGAITGGVYSKFFNVGAGSGIRDRIGSVVERWLCKPIRFKTIEFHESMNSLSTQTIRDADKTIWHHAVYPEGFADYSGMVVKRYVTELPQGFYRSQFVRAEKAVYDRMT
ncbi:MAG: RHS repeat-associated core domain-containing protein [Methanomassiliicoccales archaeon]